MGLLRLPERLRSELSKPHGLLLTGDLDSNVDSVLSLIRQENPPKVVVVGDYALTGFIKFGYMPSLGIYDRKTKRFPFPLTLEPTEVTKNPPGHISDEAVLAIRRLISSPSPSLLYVDGEEDLLSIPAILHSPEGSFVIYGLPSKGMVVIKVDKEIKKKVTKILEDFERVS
ncbi:MAG: DUF359 domain-containing protein [Candidatus Methanomethyliales bacterium]|nr:DUF359 domain-containing protein [Candidatus Methanomethylicales archaeon]